MEFLALNASISLATSKYKFGFLQNGKNTFLNSSTLNRGKLRASSKVTESTSPRPRGRAIQNQLVSAGYMRGVYVLIHEQRIHRPASGRASVEPGVWGSGRREILLGLASPPVSLLRLERSTACRSWRGTGYNNQQEDHPGWWGGVF